MLEGTLDILPWVPSPLHTLKRGSGYEGSGRNFPGAEVALPSKGEPPLLWAQSLDVLCLPLFIVYISFSTSDLYNWKTSKIL